MAFRARPRWFTAATVLSIILLCACASQQPAASPSPGAEGPVEPKVRRAVLAVEPPSAESNVLRQLSTTTGWPMFPMYEWLIDVDPKTGKDQAQLATGWKLEPDGASWRFQLRKGVKFHGDWGEFTGNDFTAGLAEKLKEDAQGNSTIYWRTILAGVDVPNDNELVLRLKRADSQFLDYVSRQIPGTEVFSRKAQEQLGEPTMQTAPLPGTGPYQFKERTAAQFLRFERVPYEHWRVRTDFPEFEFRWMKEASTRLASLLTGEVQLASLPDDLLAQAEGRGYKSVRGPVPAFRLFLSFQCCVLNDPKDKNSGYINPNTPLKDPVVRRALSKAINRDELNKGFFSGKGTLLYNNPFHPTRKGWDPSWETRFQDEYGYDPPKARELLQQAGYTAANPLKVNFAVAATQGFSSADDIIEAISNYFRTVGIQVQLDIPPTPAALMKFDNHIRFNGTSSTAWGGILNFGSNLATSGRTSLNDWDADQLMEQVGSTTDEEKLEQRWREVGEHLYKSHRYVPLVWLPVEIAVDPKIVSDVIFPGSLTGNWTHMENIKAAR